MTQVTFGSVPPKTLDLQNGHVRIYFDVVEDIEEFVIHNEDNEGTKEVENRPCWRCFELDIQAPLSYDKVVEALIRTKYSISDELGILRQKDTKPLEFEEYNTFAEDCKAKAKAILE